MTGESSQNLPICGIVKDDPARPPLSRRIKYYGMRAAGRLATVLSHFPHQASATEFGILLYHRIAPIVRGFAPPTHNVPPDAFREHLVGLGRQGFTFLSLREVLRRRADNKTLPPRAVVITFDDGFESAYEFAWPTLRELNVPATIFINTGYLDDQTPFPFDSWGQAYAHRVPPVSYRPITSAQCRTMADTGLIELGAHTHTHADFRGNDNLFRSDMQTCLRQLQSHFGVTKPTFAFPYGKPSTGYTEKELLEVVREMALPCALTTEAVSARLADSPYSWGRFNAYDWDDSRTLAAKLLGYYSWAPRLAEGVAQLWTGRTARSAWEASRQQESN